MNLVKKQDGFTLVEIMVAMMVMTLGLVAAAGMQTHAVDENNYANRLSAGITDIEHWMEDIMTRPIMEHDDNISDIFTNENIKDGTWQDDTCSSAPKSHDIEYRVIVGSPMENLTTVQIEVDPTGVGWKNPINITYIRSTRWN